MPFAIERLLQCPTQRHLPGQECNIKEVKRLQTQQLGQQAISSSGVRGGGVGVCGVRVPEEDVLHLTPLEQQPWPCGVCGCLCVCVWVWVRVHARHRSDVCVCVCVCVCV